MNEKDSKAKEDTEMVDEHEKHGAVADQGLNEENQTFTEQEVRKIKELSQRPDLYEVLVNSLAPSIWEN
jgi:DNA replicative helicase MCM subunit Mcm2 (Cdc46/Mcm family)